MSKQTESVLVKKWVLVEVNSKRGEELGCEDSSIFTTDWEEVLGSSEWLRCTTKVLQHMIDLHNDSLSA